MTGGAYAQNRLLVLILEDIKMFVLDLGNGLFFSLDF